MCIFDGVLCVWDQILVVLVTKMFCRVRKRMLDKIVFRQSHVVVFFFYFFSSACFFYIISSMSPQVLAKYLGGTSKSHVFEKICIHLV